MASEPAILILAGGSGTRFWPLSRRDRPKQLLRLFEELSLLQRTVARVRPLASPERVWICTTERLAEQVAAQLPEVPRAQVLAEPEPRNTAPAIAWAVTQMPEDVQNGAIVVLAADHFVSDEPAFCEAVALAVETACERRRILTLGVVPRWAETGYGYLELEREVGDTLEAMELRRFVEKPDATTAEEFVAGGRHLWNAGNFVFRGDVFLERVARDLPELSEGLARLAESESGTAEYSALYGALPKISVDHGVMERQKDLMTVPLDCGWNDVGSWQALAELVDPDADGNRARGRILTHEAQRNFVYVDGAAEPKTVALLGVDDLVVVQTEDAILVMPRERSQHVRALVDALEAAEKEALL